MTDHATWRSAESGPFLGGHRIDRTRPINFQIGGRIVAGYAGDTILSSLLASGILVAGEHYDAPLGLDEALGLRAHVSSEPPEMAIPIRKMPAIDGNTYKIVARHSHVPILRKIFNRAIKNSSLQILFEAGRSAPSSRSADVPHHGGDADLIVVGGGLAGLSAAVRAAELGQSVTLFEQRAYLGGDSNLFGHAAGEEAPEHAQARLEEAAQSLGVKIYTDAEVVSSRTGRVDVDLLSIGDSGVRLERKYYSAKHIILATGCADRLPVFSGNRSPGVISLATMYHLASGYGIWPNGNPILSTTSNASYRLGLLAENSGGSVERVIDNRVEPQSRFIEFAKAYGIKFTFGEQIRSAEWVAGAQHLDLTTTLAFGDKRESGHHVASALIVSGGWVPRLSLWQCAGGGTVIDAARGGISASGKMPNVTLAGSAAGLISLRGVLDDGCRAAEKLQGKKGRAAKDKHIDTAFESREGDYPAAAQPLDVDAPAYLGLGPSLATIARPQPRGWDRSSAAKKRSGYADVEDVALGLDDVGALVALNRISADLAQHIIAERVLTPELPSVATDSARPLPNTTAPTYLHGRFGSKPSEWCLQAESGQILEIGDLLFATSDIEDPAQAVGTLVDAPAGQPPIALLSRDIAAIGTRVFARSTRKRIWAEVISPNVSKG